MPMHRADDVVIIVKDNGIGIPPPVLLHVFELFTQSASNPAHAEGGLGIGLAVVKHLVTLHNGTVSLSSAGEGRGTEVTVRLPIACRSAPENATAQTNGVMPTRILLVDDNADALEALGKLLALEGHEVRLAHGGAAALAIVDSFTPQIALIDIGMPGMDGLQLARLRPCRSRPTAHVTNSVH